MTYAYRHVDLVRVIDGDTVRLMVDMGNHIRWTQDFRLAGIDTPERGKPGAAEATAHLSNLISNGIAGIETYKPDKYGRYLVDIYVSTSGGELLVNKLMVIDGHAKPYDGGKKI